MTESVAAPAGVDVGRYWSMLASRWRVVLVGGLIGALLGAGYLFLMPPSFTATTTLTVLPITSDPYASNRNTSNLLDMSAEATIAASFKVAELAAESVGDDWDVTGLRTATTAIPGAETSTMTITVTADSEDRARAGASAMAEAYIETRSNQATSTIDAWLTRDNDRIEQLRLDLADAIRRLETARPGSPAAAEASADQQLVNQQILALLTRIRSLEAVDTTGGVILNPASLTRIVVEPGLVKTLATGLAAGVLLGIVAAFVIGTRRRHVRTAQQVQRELGIDILGVIHGQTAGADTAALTQWLLRATVDDGVDTGDDGARVITVLLDESVPAQSGVVEDLAGALRAAGVSARIMTSAHRGSHEPGDLVLVPVAGDAPVAERLQALRVSDLVVVVAVLGATQISELVAAIEEAMDMGARIGGMVLLDRARAATVATAA